MSDDNNPLGRVEKAREEEYIRRHEQQLIEKLRKKLKYESETAALKAATGVDDEELLHHLAELGIDRDTVPVLHLVPLIEVAWADGEIQADELDLLRSAANEAGLKGPAATLFESMLQTPPSRELCDSALRYINAMVKALPQDQANKATDNLVDLVYRVADAAGGVFGLWGRVEDSEKAALRHIASVLSDANPDAAKRLLDKL